MDGRETLKSDQRWSQFGQDGFFHSVRHSAAAVCSTCGERVQAGASVCEVCGQPLTLATAAAPNEAPYSSRTSGKAHASLLLGCASLLLLPGLAAVILGHWALSEIKKSSGRLRGRRTAWAGLILGYFGLVGTPAFLILTGLPQRWLQPAPINENRALTSLRELNIALQAYAATYANGFPENLSQLGPPAGQAALDSKASGFVTGDLASGRAYGFHFTYVVTGRNAQGRPAQYKITADPLPSDPPGLPHFFTDQSQVIRATPLHAANARSAPAIIEPGK